MTFDIKDYPEFEEFCEAYVAYTRVMPKSSITITDNGLDRMFMGSEDARDFLKGLVSTTFRVPAIVSKLNRTATKEYNKQMANFR